MEILKSKIKGVFSRPQNPKDWWSSDRAYWRQASMTGSVASQTPRINSFVAACIYNTKRNSPSEYRRIAERHDYYDFISYALKSGK